MDGTHKDASYRPEYNLQDYQWLYLQHGLPLDAIQRMTVFIEITDKQIEDWTNDPSRFLTEEKLIVGAKSAPSIRRNAKDILLVGIFIYFFLEIEFSHPRIIYLRNLEQISE